MPWHDDDAFWQAVGPGLFDREHLEAAGREVDEVAGLARLEPGARVLDLCCGVGRHSLELARRGFAVTGVDRTAAYLEQARGRARAEGLEIEFVQADMREFRRDSGFDAAINLYTSFGYFDDPAEDRRVLLNIHASLKPGGPLVVQMMGKEVLARIFRERHWDESEGCMILQEGRIARDWGWIENRWIVVAGDEVKEFKVEHRLYSGVEFRELLGACGFASAEMFGSLSGAPYDHQAERLVALARA